MAICGFGVSGALAQPPATAGEAAEPPMGFFVTSANPGSGGDLGGLEGADGHCQALAEAAGSARIWAAYLSTQATDDAPAVNARDRIGEGPWSNAAGTLMARSVDDLHFNNANLVHENMLNENGDMILSTAVGDEVNQHDILTGTLLSGMAPLGGEDQTCGNWTSSGEGRAIVGHSDRMARGIPGSPWNQAHPSRGCSMEDLAATGSAGMFYCFATDAP